MGKRLKLSLLALPVIAVAVLAFGGTAAAGGNGNSTWVAQDPQTANIPYLAWVGNQVKISKCVSLEGLGADQVIPFPFLRGKFRVEDWSGVDENNSGPTFLNSIDGDVTGSIVLTHLGPRLCFSVHTSSLKPGLAVIKLAVRPDLVGLLPGADVLAKHQFLVIWMRSLAPTIREVADADFPDISVGDPSGNGVFNLADPFGANNGLVQINVKGTAPMGNDFAGQWPNDSITLPDDWRALALRYAFDDDDQAGGIPGSGAARWDIHDDKTPYEPHAGANTCTPRSGTVDAVDNCLGGPQNGQFSFYYGYSQPSYPDGRAAVGPFDPIRPLNSLLSDNKLDADDAPMPPIRIDTFLAPGSAGGLEAADKDDIYVRDQTTPGVTDETPHNLYAPFYEALIPAVLPFDEGQTSGVAGSFANNFPGFLTDYYDYWELLRGWTNDPLRGQVRCLDELGQPRWSPRGYDQVAVYTDEHGEAIVAFNPNTGFNFAVDSNGRCDLDPNVPHSATITAEAIYPDQPVIWDQLRKVSNALTKVVNLAHAKTLNCVPKGPNEMFCVETIRDVRGRPVAGARVQFSRSPLGAIQADAALHGGFDTRGQVLESQSTAEGVIVRTNLLGQAGVVVTETRNICVDVTAENLGTRISAQNPGVKRFIFINPSVGAVLTVCGPGSGGANTTVIQPVVTTPTTQPTGTTAVVIQTAPAASAEVVSLAGNPVPAAAEKAQPKAKAPAIAKATLRSAQVMTIKGNRYLVIQLKSKLNSAKVRITLMGKNGKVQKVVIRKVATNRMVIVPNLKFGSQVRSVKVSVI